MPRIHDEFLDAVFYIYPTLDAAQKGETSGGSGFFVSIPSAVDKREEFIYAVTNKHVLDMPHPVLRLNTKDCGLDFIETSKLNWIDAQDDDLSILHVDLQEQHKFDTIDISLFLSREDITQHDIGSGDDVFMVGRFINRAGIQQNTPSVRFGNISIMYKERVKHDLGHFQENITVEMRSISGYSGSPVFVHIPPLALRPNAEYLDASAYHLWLLTGC